MISERLTGRVVPLGKGAFGLVLIMVTKPESHVMYDHLGVPPHGFGLAEVFQEARIAGFPISALTFMSRKAWEAVEGDGGEEGGGELDGGG